MGGSICGRSAHRWPGVGLGWICAGKIGICEGFQVHSIIQMVLGIYKVYIYIFVLRCFKGGLIFMYL